MTDPQIQQLIKELEPLLDQKIKESHSTGLESGNKESSRLVDDVLKKVANKLDESHGEIKRRLDTANGYTAKHEQRLNTQDVLNAQMTITQQQTAKTLEGLLEKIEILTTAKASAEGSLATFKWLFGLNLAGLGGVLAKMFLIQ